MNEKTYLCVDIRRPSNNFDSNRAGPAGHWKAFHNSIQKAPLTVSWQMYMAGWPPASHNTRRTSGHDYAAVNPTRIIVMR